MLNRFWSKVDQSGGPDACWPWKASLDGRGYGQFWWKGKKRIAHRVAFTLEFDAPKLNVLHTCDNPPCCNPSHLYDGTLKQNTADMMRRGRARYERHLGSDHGRARLDEQKVRAIRRSKASARQLAMKYGVSISAIHMARLRYNWKHVV